MDGLEMAEMGSRLRVDREQGIAKEAITDPVAAIAVIGRRAEGQIRNAALVIDGDHIPGVHAGAVFPAVAFPGAEIGLTRLGNGIKLPQRLAADDIDAADIAAGAVGWVFLTS